MAEYQSDIVRVTAGAVLVVLLVVTLYVGRAILLPIVTAAILTLILIRAADALGTVPLVGALPATVRRFLVLAVVAFAAVLLGLLIADMVDLIAAALPGYEANIEALVSGLANRIGLDDTETWPHIWRSLQDMVDLQTLGLRVFSSAGSIAATVLLVAVYSGFLIAERGALYRKLSLAVGNEEKAERLRGLLIRVSDTISEYLATKTLINIILGIVSYLILKVFGVDFALFWAVLIAFLNYIPYMGSFMGVAFPVVLSLGQFGAPGVTVALLVALSAVQMVVGNLLEPWLLGRRVNLSPFVVIVSLVLWAAIWGLPGAILAVPLTSAIAITCAAFPTLRPIAILLSAGYGDREVAHERAA